MNATPNEIAWMAGLLEGEGSFMLVRNHPLRATRDYFYPTIVLGMTDADVIERAAKLFGVSWRFVQNTRGKKRFYRTSVVGSRAVEWMKAILPMMGARRTQKIAALLQAWYERENSTATRAEFCSKAAAGRSRTLAGQFAKNEAGS